VPIFDLKNGRKIWEWVRVQIGRPEVRWHDLRHTHATMLGRTSKDPRIVQRQLGHTHIATSMGYITTEDAETIAAVEKIAPLTDRKVAALNRDAGPGTEPPPGGTHGRTRRQDSQTPRRADLAQSFHHQTTGCVAPVRTLMKPSGASSQGATRTHVQGAQVSVANINLSGNPGYQRGRKVGSYIQSIFSASL
jgi:Phage integrase family